MAVGFVWPLSGFSKKENVQLKFDFFDSSLTDHETIKKLTDKAKSIIGLINLGFDLNKLINNKNNKNILQAYFLFFRLSNFLTWIHDDYDDFIKFLKSQEARKNYDLTKSCYLFLSKYEFFYEKSDKVEKLNKMILSDDILSKIIEINNSPFYVSTFKNKPINNREYLRLLENLNSIKYFDLLSADPKDLEFRNIKNTFGDNCLFNILFIDELCYQNSLKEEEFRYFENKRNLIADEIINKDISDFKDSDSYLKFYRSGFSQPFVLNFLKNAAIENNKNIFSRPKEFYNYDKTVDINLRDSDSFRNLLDDICSFIERRNYKIYYKGFIDLISAHKQEEKTNNDLINFNYDYKKIHFQDDINKCKKLIHFIKLNKLIENQEDNKEYKNFIEEYTVLFDYLIVAENESGFNCPVNLRFFVTHNHRPYRRKFYINDEFISWIQFSGFVPLYQFDGLFKEIEEYLKSKTIFHFLLLRHLLRHSCLFFNSDKHNYYTYDGSEQIKGIFYDYPDDRGTADIFKFFVNEYASKISPDSYEKIYSLFFEETINSDSLKSTLNELLYTEDFFYTNINEKSKLNIISLADPNRNNHEINSYFGNKYLGQANESQLNININYNLNKYAIDFILNKINSIFVTPAIPVNKNNKTLIDYIVNWFELQFLKNYKMYENYKCNSRQVLNKFFELTDFLYKYYKDDLDKIIKFKTEQQKNSETKINILINILNYLQAKNEDCLFFRFLGAASHIYPAAAACYLVIPPKFADRDIYIYMNHGI